jgi:hypothetical protein
MWRRPYRPKQSFSFGPSGSVPARTRVGQARPARRLAVRVWDVVEQGHRFERALLVGRAELVQYRFHRVPLLGDEAVHCGQWGGLGPVDRRAGEQPYTLLGVGVHVVQYATERGIVAPHRGCLGEPCPGEVQGQLSTGVVGARHGELGAFGRALDAVQRVAGGCVLAGGGDSGNRHRAGGHADDDGAPGADPAAGAGQAEHTPPGLADAGVRARLGLDRRRGRADTIPLGRRDEHGAQADPELGSTCTRVWVAESRWPMATSSASCSSAGPRL